MIPFERVAECIRKLQVVANVETDADKKRLYTAMCKGLQKELDTIIKENIPCPPEMEESVDKSLKLIEDLYEKKACN